MLSVKLSPEAPSNFTASGVLLNADDDALQAELASHMKPVWNNWIEHRPIPSPVEGCEGICTVKVRAPALELVDCAVLERHTVNLTSMVLANGTVLSPCSISGGVLRCASLDVQTQPAARSGSETIIIGYGNFAPERMGEGQDCAGTHTYRACWYRAVVAEYNIKTYNNSFVQILSSHPRMLASVNNTKRSKYTIEERINTTLAGIALLASMDNYTSIGLWRANETYRYTDNVATFHAKLMANAERFYSLLDCAPKWRDPTSDLIATMNNLLFRTAVFATRNMSASELASRIDPGLQTTYDVQGTRIDAQPVFQTRWSFFWAATAVQLICVSFVLTTYRNYWKLGRTTTLSPLEIAIAFDAPLLRHLSPNQKAWQLAERLGKQRIKYGVQEPGRDQLDDHGLRLIFAAPENVQSPMNGSR